MNHPPRKSTSEDLARDWALMKPLVIEVAIGGVVFGVLQQAAEHIGWITRHLPDFSVCIAGRQLSDYTC